MSFPNVLECLGGPKFLYRITWRDDYDTERLGEIRCWAYDEQSARDWFADGGGVDADGPVIVSVERIP